MKPIAKLWLKMNPIRAGQIKAARALLDWSQNDLADAAGLSINTIRNLELGYISPRGSTTNVVRQALEDAGLEFIDNEGIKRRMEEVKIYQGADSCHMFFNDILQTIREKPGDIVCVAKSQEIVAQSYGVKNFNHLDRLERLSEIANVKCLLSDAAPSRLFNDAFQFRTISRYHAGPVSYYVYGDKYAVVLTEKNDAFRFVVFKSMSLAQAYHANFMSLWDNAPPLLIQVSGNKRRVKR